MGRHAPEMRVRDLDNGRELTLMAQVYAWPDPTVPAGMYLGVRNLRDAQGEDSRAGSRP